MSILGADSAVPEPDEYAGRQFWGVYVADHRTTPHVWTQDEVKALNVSGVKRALPICVAPLSWPWPLGIEGELALLCAEAQAWGVPLGVPLVLDIEEQAAEAAGGSLPLVISTWKSLCQGKYESWAYGGLILGDDSDGVFRWLAKWILPMGQAPSVPPQEVPNGYSAWQYAGQIGTIDLDIITGGALARLMLTADLSAPKPDPPDPPKEDNDVAFIVTGSKGGKHLIDGAWRLPLKNDAIYKRYVAAGVKEETGWTDADIAEVPIAKEHVL